MSLLSEEGKWNVNYQDISLKCRVVVRSGELKIFRTDQGAWKDVRICQ